MTDFRDRLEQPITHLQKAVGIRSYSFMHGVLSGKEPCSVDLAKRIEAATGGAIRWTEFFEHEEVAS